ncbi:MAG: 2-iminoacetate synthase ThiH [Syntrophobacteraceae bacterium]|nr:2-iminoacetate synthase ThiH [Syntrophobacteraceae bacterium]
MSFHEILKSYRWDDVGRDILARDADDVRRSLAARNPAPQDLLPLLSPAAEPFLEEMAQRAHRLTEQRFGRVINLFAPVYVSNECINSCVYCGFNRVNPVSRLTLTPRQVAVEGRHLHDAGFRHVLLVSGENPHVVTLEYLTWVVDLLRPLFSSISIEIYPLEAEEYEELIDHGVDGLVIYQETYDEARYPEFHPGGRKKDFHWRLETPERGGKAGFRRLGIGALLGLGDWRVEGFFLGLHARYLLKNFWKSQVTISFPRLKPAVGGFAPPHPVGDAQLVQLLVALRLFLPDVGFTLSTREPPHLRDHLIPLGVTSMSAGSSTEPGGYTHTREAGAQFEVADERSPAEIAELIRRKGYEPVWKDWDPAFLEREAVNR